MSGPRETVEKETAETTAISGETAIGTSLLSVGTFGVAAGAEDWFYGEVLILIAILYVIGGVAGGYAGTSIAVKAPRKTLRIAYGIIIVLVGIYMLLRIYHVMP